MMDGCRAGSALFLWTVVLLLVAQCAIAPAVALNASVDLEIGSSGSVPFHVSGIKPGDNGTIAIDLHNNGPHRCIVHLFVTNISEQDFSTDGAHLDDYLRFTISHSTLEGNITFPAFIRDLPDAYPSNRTLNITHINASETIPLSWQWEFQETGSPTNDVQGDSLTFDIVFVMEDLTPAASPASPPSPAHGSWHSSGIQQSSNSFVSPVVSIPASPTPEPIPSPVGPTQESRDGSMDHGSETRFGVDLSGLLAGPDTALLLPVAFAVLILGLGAMVLRKMYRSWTTGISPPTLKDAIKEKHPGDEQGKSGTGAGSREGKDDLAEGRGRNR